MRGEEQAPGEVKENYEAGKYNKHNAAGELSDSKERMIHHLEAELLQILREGSSFLRDVSMQLQQDRRLFLCHFIKHCSHLLLCELNGTGDFIMNGLLNGATLAAQRRAGRVEPAPFGNRSES